MNTKKIIAMFATGMVCTLFAVAGPSVTSNAAEETTTMAAVVNVHVRGAANNSGAVLGVLSAGEAVQVTGVEGGWYKVLFKDQAGYVYNPYLNFEGATDGDVANGRETDMKTVCNVHLRKENTVNSVSLATVPANEKVQVVRKVDGWYKVHYQDATGYIRADYLDFLKGSETPAAPAAKSTETAMTATTPVNVRAGASPSSKVLGVLKKDEQVISLGLENGWCKVTYKDQTGYVCAEYLKSNEEKTMKSTVAVYIRSDSSNSGKVLGVLEKDGEIKTVGMKNGWYEVEYNGTIGYIYHTFLK